MLINGQDPHVYVAKTFLPDEAESFANERDAYKRIEEESGQPIESLLQCYGSYTHKDTHTLLLEYCNGGTLETCFAKPQPRREKEILAFWTGLLGLVKAVHRLNVVHG
jgi:serine/threonine protein kinase